MATCRKRAALARNRPSITTKAEEKILQANATLAQDGGADFLLDAIPGFGVEPAKVDFKADKKSKPVKKQEPKTTEKDGD